MKSFLKILIGAALVLSFFDGFATYYELTVLGILDPNPWPALLQEVFGLKFWLLAHIVLYSLFGLILFLIRAKWKLRNLAIYIWFSAEVIVAIFHVYTLMLLTP